MTLSPLADEIRAFRLGFGSPAALVRALRGTTLIIPVDRESHVVTFHSIQRETSAVKWVCGHTTPERSAGFADDQQNGSDWRFVALTGTYLLDELLPGLSRPTGLFVDPGTVDAMTFPPTRDLVPRAEWAVDVEQK